MLSPLKIAAGTHRLLVWHTTTFSDWRFQLYLWASGTQDLMVQNPSHAESVQVMSSLAYFPKRGPETTNHPCSEHLATSSHAYKWSKKRCKQRGDCLLFLFTQCELRELERPIWKELSTHVCLTIFLEMCFYLVSMSSSISVSMSVSPVFIFPETPN